MKKTLKVILWTFVAILGTFLFGTLVFSLNYLKATHIMHPSETGIINDSVWCIEDMYVNTYLFKGKTGYIMIDGGLNKKNLAKELDRLDIKSKKISAVFLTRTDEDHIGSIGLFKNAIIYMSKDEEQMVNGRTKYNNPRWKYGPYILLNNNDSVNVDGLNIKILLPPGHTPGSASYEIGNEYLATGDNLVLKNRKYEPIQGKLNNMEPDPSNFKYILTAHYGYVKE